MFLFMKDIMIWIFQDFLDILCREFDIFVLLCCLCFGSGMMAEETSISVYTISQYLCSLCGLEC